MRDKILLYFLNEAFFFLGFVAADPPVKTELNRTSKRDSARSVIEGCSLSHTSAQKIANYT